MRQKALLMVLTGPSGSGKTTLSLRLLNEIEVVRKVIATTTRAPRMGEVDGIDYHFQTPEKFADGLEKNAYVEHAKVYDHYYGVAKEDLERPCDEGKDLVLCVDVQGARTLKRQWQSAASGRRLLCIFVSPSDLGELERRLLRRGTDDAQTIRRRLQMAEKELEILSQFDYYLCSRDKASDWQSLQHIYFAEKMRI